MQCIVREGDDYVWATHEDGQDVSDRYPAVKLKTAAGTVAIPRGVVVAVPYGFTFAEDVTVPVPGLGTVVRLKDPRRFAGKGSTPLAP
jgi:hypothetical protein